LTSSDGLREEVIIPVEDVTFQQLLLLNLLLLLQILLIKDVLPPILVVLLNTVPSHILVAKSILAVQVQVVTTRAVVIIGVISIVLLILLLMPTTTQRLPRTTRILVLQQMVSVLVLLLQMLPTLLKSLAKSIVVTDCQEILTKFRITTALDLIVSPLQIQMDRRMNPIILMNPLLNHQLWKLNLLVKQRTQTMIMNFLGMEFLVLLELLQVDESCSSLVILNLESPQVDLILEMRMLVETLLLVYLQL